MLKVVEVSSDSERQKFLQSFDADSGTWLISDLDHKKELQNIYLEKNGFLLEDSCLRARELWLKLFRQSYLDIQIVSNDFIKLLLSHWLKNQNVEWARGGTSTATLFSYLEAFAPILDNDDAKENLKAWLLDSPSSLKKWGAWFHLSINAWEHLKQFKVIPSSWVASMLLQNQEFQWQRQLYVDVGVDLSAVEAELLQKLAVEIDVTVLAPEARWIEAYPQSLWVYNLLKSEALPDLMAGELKPVESKIHCVENVSPLVEIKNAVAQIRYWLDQGVLPSEVSIYCRDPETYWPTLQSYLQVENIPVNKDIVFCLASLPQLSQWVSALKSHSDRFSSADIEAWIYAMSHHTDIRYEKFRSLLGRIYEENNLNFIPEIFEKRQNTKSLDSVLTREQFLLWALHHYPQNSDINDLEPVISRFITECPDFVSLSLADWISGVESYLSKSERVLKKSDPAGVRIKKLESSPWEKADYRILLGMQDSELLDVSSINISQSEVQKIGNDLGFYFPVQESRRYELLVNWNLHKKCKELIFSYAQNSFSGDSESPSAIWSVNALKHGLAESTLSSDQKSRWDLLQEMDTADIFNQEIKIQLDKDLGILAFQNPQSFEPKHLSASQIRNYVNCAFKYFSSSALKLRDEPELMMDMDRLRRGNLIHKVLELILAKGIDNQWNENSLNELIEQALMQLKTPYFASLWKFQKYRLVQEAQRFIDFEKDWRAKYPQVKTVARELKFEGEFQGVKFKGTIDRVDRTASGDYIIIDYKSSAGDLSNAKSWVTNREFQLYIYCLALESGWTEMPSGSCVAAVYFDLKSMNRNTGMIQKDLDPQVFDVPPRASLSLEEVQELKRSCQQELVKIVAAIKNGEFAPVPLDAEKICPNCEWRRLCRAPHLN